MKYNLGPRTIFYIDKDGSHRPLLIRIGFQKPEVINLGDDQITQISGVMTFESAWSFRPIKILGEDKIQTIYRLMAVADGILQTVAKNTGITIYKNIPGDIVGPMDVFT